MKQFKKTFWRGYQKEEVDEYIDFLTEELENLKKETNRVLEKNRDSLAEMKEEMEHERKEKEYLEEQVEKMKKQAKEQEEEMEKKIGELLLQIDKYKEDYDAVPHILAIAQKKASGLIDDAKKDSESMVEEAKTEAEKITVTAQKEAEAYLTNAHREISEKLEADRKRFILARGKLAEYLKNLNQSQNRLIETYNELGNLIGKMPLRVDDLFSLEPFELFEKGKFIEGVKDEKEAGQEKAKE